MRIPIQVPQGVELPQRNEPLSFTEWLNDRKHSTYVERNKKGKIVYIDEFLNSDAQEYANYLNSFNEEPSVLSFTADFDQREIHHFGKLHPEYIESIEYIGRCSKGGDLFIVRSNKGEIGVSKGELKGLFLEIED